MAVAAQRYPILIVDELNDAIAHRNKRRLNKQRTWRFVLSLSLGQRIETEKHKRITRKKNEMGRAALRQREERAGHC